MPSSPPRPTINTLKATETWLRCPIAAAAKALVQTRLTIRLATSASRIRSERSPKETETVNKTSDASAASLP